jgi:3',5'-cyclic AMP phosphodiesterase CpdA
VKILCTSDLHLVPAWRSNVLKVLNDWVRVLKPDALLVAGDIAVAAEADPALRELRRVFPHGPIIAALGNHDFWVGSANECRTLAEVVERFWQVPTQRYEVTLLDQENFNSPETTFIGGYGHYDLGFAVPELRYEGKTVTREHYLRGRPPVETPLRWRDFDWMPRAADPSRHSAAETDVIKTARSQIAAVQSRIEGTDSSRVVLALHTPPFEELLGIPDASTLDPENPPIRAFFRAYLGNCAMGEMLRAYARRIAGLICGHTHRPAGPTDMGGFWGVNTGSDYGTPRGLMLDTTEPMMMTPIAELIV